MADRSEKKKQREAAGMAAIGSLITLEDIAAFSTADLVAKVAGTELQTHSASPGQLGRAGTSVAQLLERFERCDKELARLQHQVDLKAERLRREVGAEESAYRAKLAGLEAQWAAARGAFADLESRMNRVTQVAAKIGNRLQNADLYRRRALDAIEAINRLQEFAHARDPSDLSPLFHDDARLAEAAAMTGKLLAVSQELISSRERIGLAGPRLKPNVAPEVGTIENAIEQLELYRNLLDNRVVSRFDAALTRHDMRAMAECARIMAEFSRGEAILIQRYISTRPMFTNLRELQFAQQQLQLQKEAAAAGASSNPAAAGTATAGEGAEVADAADVAALRALSSFYKSILATMRDEAVVIEQVFPSPARALGQYTQRVFEQKVQTAVDAVLSPLPPNAPVAALRAKLKMVAEVYRKTRGLADDLQELCGGQDAHSSGGINVRELADGVCADPLGAYLSMELRWLRGQYEARLAAYRAAGKGLDREEVACLLAMNEEAVARCALLSPPAQLAASVRCLFHSSTHKAANTGCLLEQVAAHLLLGLGLAVEACGKALQGPFKPQQLLQQERQAAAAKASGTGTAAAGAGGGSMHGSAGAPAAAPATQQQQQQAAAATSAISGPLTRQDLHRAAAAGMAASLGVVLTAITTVGAMVAQLQQHYQRVVAPHLAGSSSEARACVAGLGALVRAVEERVLGALQRCLALLLSQADMTLVAEQQRWDFSPPENVPPPPLDTPTNACLAVCALLGAAVEAAQKHLHGPNLASFLSELGRRACLMLEAHQQRFTFSPLGALRWKRDLAEYAALAARLRAAAVTQRMEEMQAAVNMLIVGPDSLLALVDGNLRISHRAALAVIQLRSDFRSARVGDAGATLAALFSSE